MSTALKNQSANDTIYERVCKRLGHSLDIKHIKNNNYLFCSKCGFFDLIENIDSNSSDKS